MATTINALRYARRLEAAGMARAHAEAVAEGAADELDDQLEQRLLRLEAGLADLRSEVTGLRADMADLRTEVRTGFADLKTSNAETKSGLLMWLIPLLSAQILAIIALLVNLSLRTP